MVKVYLGLDNFWLEKDCGYSYYRAPVWDVNSGLLKVRCTTCTIHLRDNNTLCWPRYTTATLHPALALNVDIGRKS